jgi:hypothetical protein
MKKQPGIKKAKPIYRLADGRAVPGVTTILGVINKPHLVGWANKLGLDGYSVSDYVGEMAKIGTLVHGIIECMVIGKTPDISDFTPNQLETAQHALRSFWHWGSVHKVEFLDSEIRLVSEEYEYGGTIDCICMIDDVKTLLDFKTSGDIYPEHLIQVAAYEELAKENGIKVDQVGILRIGRGPDGGISEHYLKDTQVYLSTFHTCRQLYGLLKDVKGKGMNGASYNDT